MVSLSPTWRPAVVPALMMTVLPSTPAIRAETGGVGSLNSSCEASWATMESVDSAVSFVGSVEPATVWPTMPAMLEWLGDCEAGPMPTARATISPLRTSMR